MCFEQMASSFQSSGLIHMLPLSYREPKKSKSCRKSGNVCVKGRMPILPFTMYEWGKKKRGRGIL
jgi:hypothetical protein